MQKELVAVKAIFISKNVFDDKTIQEVKQTLDKISNDNIHLLYQNCTAKFIVGQGEFENELYLVFQRMETDAEYHERIKAE
jgi:UDP-2,3-diacylglucosamine pyrophosphatase LpxH